MRLRYGVASGKRVPSVLLSLRERKRSGDEFECVEATVMKQFIGEYVLSEGDSVGEICQFEAQEISI